MITNNMEHCRMFKYEKDGELKIIDFIADSDYCFRNIKNVLFDDDGNEYYDHFTAFSLLSLEFDTLSDYKCIPFEEGMVIH